MAPRLTHDRAVPQLPYHGDASPAVCRSQAPDRREPPQRQPHRRESVSRALTIDGRGERDS